MSLFGRRNDRYRSQVKLFITILMLVMVMTLATISFAVFFKPDGTASLSNIISSEDKATDNSYTTSEPPITEDTNSDSTQTTVTVPTKVPTAASAAVAAKRKASSENSNPSTSDASYEQALASLPAGLLEKVKIAIDPGHGGMDPGSLHGNLLEKDLNLAVALQLGNMLEDMGINVIYTRKTDIFPSLKKRAQIVEDSGADFFLCIHHNATDDGPVWEGTETHYQIGGSPAGVMDDKKFGRYIQEEVVNALGFTDLGLVHSPNMVVLKMTSMPAVIAELGYITSDRDRAVLTAPGYAKKAAIALKKGIIRAIAAKFVHS